MGGGARNFGCVAKGRGRKISDASLRSLIFSKSLGKIKGHVEMFCANLIGDSRELSNPINNEYSLTSDVLVVYFFVVV